MARSSPRVISKNRNGERREVGGLKKKKKKKKKKRETIFVCGGFLFVLVTVVYAKYRYREGSSWSRSRYSCSEKDEHKKTSNMKR